MAIKIYELAKELNMQSREVLEKCSKAGIEASSHMSSISDIDADRLRLIFEKKQSMSETKIVKASSKKPDEKTVEEAPRTTKKATIVLPATRGKAQKEKGRQEEKIETRKPPLGKPVVSKEVEGRPKPPQGKVVINKELDEREAKRVRQEEAKVQKDSIKSASPKTALEVKPVETRTVPVTKKPPFKEEKHVKKEERKQKTDQGVKKEKQEPQFAKGEKPQVPVKPSYKQEDRRGKDKDRGHKSAQSPQKKQRRDPFQGINALEKTPKPRKHVKPPKAVEEEEQMMEIPEGTFVINVPITVAGFSEQVEIPSSKAIMELMRLGIMATVNQNMDEDTVLILAESLGISVLVGKVREAIHEEGIDDFEDREDQLKKRPPIITIMGHVDHGKTSLLDAIRKTNVTSSESGGITQHIGAYEVVANGEKIVFLDTPGHEAFTAMRARGAHITDIAVLVVAADDSVMPQTLESISHAKAAGVPIIVAINKIDKPTANIDKVKKDLSTKGVLVEEWGGNTISVPVSAKTGEGINSLLEMILLQAEVMELKANPSRAASGTVIEARLDTAKGPVATLLVLNGTLQTGQPIVMGTSSGRIRLMTDYKGETIKKAGPGTAVEILGLSEVPESGDEFNVVKDLVKAKEIAERRKQKVREEVLARNAGSSLEKLFSQLKEGEIKELNLIIKGDVQGSVDAVKTNLEKLKTENIRTNIIHAGVGTVTESDVMLAGTVGAVIIGFNVRPSTPISQFAEKENIEIRTYRVIYDLIEDVEKAMRGMLDPVFEEVLLGKAEVRETFKVPGIGIVAGSYITEGKFVRNERVRLLRDGVIIHEGKISSLKRMKDDAREVKEGFECGIGIENYNDIKIGDVMECFKMEEIERG